jgi:predicted ATPase
MAQGLGGSDQGDGTRHRGASQCAVVCPPGSAAPNRERITDEKWGHDEHLLGADMSDSGPPDGVGHERRRLDSWKEIAAYLRRDVKTARRWEQREGLPVYRHHHGALGSVYAFVDEIEAWRVGRRAAATATARLRRAAPTLVGRDCELSRLHSILDRAATGERQMVFITGPTGVGKTALLRAFLTTANSRAAVAEGECIEHFGHVEPFLPFTDALVHLAAGPERRRVIDALREHAPSWADLVLQGRTAVAHAATSPDVTGTRASRELCRLIEVLAASTPLVVAIGNMHLIDTASLQILARLARRTDPTQLMVIGTYRTEGPRRSQPALSELTRELRAHFQCVELSLSPLGVEEVGEYLDRTGTWTTLADVATWFHQRSGGNPLFLEHLLQHLGDIGAIITEDGCRTLDPEVRERTDIIPNTLRGLVEVELAHLDDTARAVLEAASIIGDCFSAGEVAEAIEVPLADVERVLSDLVRQGELIQQDSSRLRVDGTAWHRYCFRHQMCRTVVQEQVPASVRAAARDRSGRRL